MSNNNLRGVQQLLLSAQSGPDALARLNADQTEVTWMERNWMFFSWAFFLFGSGCLAAFRFLPRTTTPPQKSNTFFAASKTYQQLWYGWLSVVMYCLHQSEEHAYDIRGWRYAFLPALNFGPIRTLYGDACVDETNPSCPLDPKITLYVNVVAIWIGFAGCMVAASLDHRFLLVGPLNWGVAVVNGVGGHIVPALMTMSYNPGVLQSTLLMVPLGLYIIFRQSDYPWICIGMGFFFHAVLVTNVNLIFRFHLPEALTCIVFNLFSGLVMPLVIANFVHSLDLKKTK